MLSRRDQLALDQSIDRYTVNTIDRLQKENTRLRKANATLRRKLREKKTK